MKEFSVFLGSLNILKNSAINEIIHLKNIIATSLLICIQPPINLPSMSYMCLGYQSSISSTNATYDYGKPFN